MKEEYTYLEPIYPGTTVSCQVEVIDVKVGKMNMVTFKNTYSDRQRQSFHRGRDGDRHSTRRYVIRPGEKQT
jgi:acyl dehydratase